MQNMLQAAIGLSPCSMLFLACVLLMSWQLLTWITSPVQPPPRIAIIVLGGGLMSKGEVPQHTQCRLDKAMELYYELIKSESSSTAVDIITLSGGTPHKPPPRDKQGFPIGEAQASASYLIKQGVPVAQIAEENFSLDTLGNAYFLRTTHIEPGGYTKLHVITNDWHMGRTRAIFSHVFNLPRRTGGHGALTRKFTLGFVSVPACLPLDTLQARIAREAESLDGFVKKNKALFSSMRELHDYIYEKHGAYASSRLVHERKPLNPAVLATY